MSNTSYFNILYVWKGEDFGELWLVSKQVINKSTQQIVGLFRENKLPQAKYVNILYPLL